MKPQAAMAKLASNSCLLVTDLTQRNGGIWNVDCDCMKAVYPLSQRCSSPRMTTSTVKAPYTVILGYLRLKLTIGRETVKSFIQSV